MNLQSAQAILIVDDDPNSTDTFSRLLQLEGFTVYTALNPEGGLEVAADKHPDAIILDLRMPILTGLQFLQHLRKTPAHPGRNRDRRLLRRRRHYVADQGAGCVGPIQAALAGRSTGPRSGPDGRLVSGNRGSVHTSRGAAPGWQGATREQRGHS